MSNPRPKPRLTIEARKEKLRAHIQSNIRSLNNEGDLAVLEAMPSTIKEIKSLIAVAGGRCWIKEYVDNQPMYAVNVTTTRNWNNEIIYIPKHPVWGNKWCIHAVLLMRLLKAASLLEET